jgi:polar amino acid transport system ATP-binding protein
MIEIADLWKSFGALPVLKGVSLQVERGSVVAIIGRAARKPAHSGLSRLLRSARWQLSGVKVVPGKRERA